MAITANILGGAVQLTGNPVWIRCTGASRPAGSTDYKILLRVTNPDGKLKGAPFVDAIAPDDNGEAMFNISGYVDQPVSADFQYPVSGAYVAHPTKAFNIQVEAGESWIDEDGILQESYGGISDVFQMLKGGNNPRQLSIMESAGTNFYQTYLEEGRFLTPRPWSDFVHPTQPVKLWFMVTENKSATLHIRGVYYDGTEDEYTTPVSLITDNLYEFNCNPADMGLDLENENGSKMYFFDVWLTVGESMISDSRRFCFNWSYCERPYFLLFANSIGGIDDVYLGGFAKENTRIEGNLIYKPRQRGDSVFEPTLVSTNRQGQNVWEINTGYKQSTEMLYLRDMMVSRQAWLLYPNLAVTGYTIIPVNVENTDVVLVDRKKNIWETTIHLAEAHSSQYSFDNRLY